jgi:hypothetical protein
MASLIYYKNYFYRFLKRKPLLILPLIAFIIILLFFFSNFEQKEIEKPKFRNNLLPSYQEANKANKKYSTSYSHFEDNSILPNELGSSIETNSHNSALLKQYIQDLIKYNPDESILNAIENQLEYTHADATHGIHTLSYLKSLASIPEKWLHEVKTKHSRLLLYLTSKIDEIKKELKDTESLTNSNFLSHGDGAVMIGGTKDDGTWLALISSRIFRKSGGVIPIEVMLPTRNDYLKDQQICDEYLPQLNAKCIIIEDLLKLSSSNNEIDNIVKYNFDSIKREIAILLSSFENVLYLTPQNIMLKSLEHNIFEKSLYKENGLFVWNDYGLRKTLPAFYDIAGITIGKKKMREFGLLLPPKIISKLNDLSNEEIKSKVSFHDLENTLPFKESDGSELIINKKQHFSTLLLSLYYNLNGKGIYYTLLTGAPDGMHGAKETVVSAAHALNNPYYSINTNVDSNGYWYDNSWNGVSMLQYDPIIDSYSYEAYIAKYSKKGKNLLTWKNYQKWLKNSSERRSPLFLNINNPALKPIELLKEGVVLKENGDRIRIISDTTYFDGSIENDIWRVMNDYICHLELDCNYLNQHFSKGDIDAKKEFCSDLKDHLLWLSN